MKICVYGASSSIIDNSFIKSGEELGKRLAQNGHTIVYGGGAEGMMGAVARGAHGVGGNVIGIAPAFFKVDGVLYDGCTDFIYTETMRERKALLEEKSDGFAVTPGGIGTFDEFFEILTLRQLGKHTKPIAIFNVNGYFNPMLDMLQNAIEKNFMTEKNNCLYFVSDNADAIIKYFENYTPEKIGLTDLKQLRLDTK